MRKMRKMRNCAQLIFVARKMCKFAPTRKPVALETLGVTQHYRGVDAHESTLYATYPPPPPTPFQFLAPNHWERSGGIVYF